MMAFHKLSDADYKKLRLKAVTKLEGYEKGVYIDTAETPKPTIGIGFNLAVDKVRDAVIADLGVDLSNDVLTAEQKARETFYFERLDEAITTFDL